MVGEGVEKHLYDAASTGDLATFQQLLQGNLYILDGVSFASSRNLLHIATIWGQLSIVEEILKIHTQLAKEFDSQKSSPLHIAAAKGNVEIVSKLLTATPHMCWSRDCHGMNPIHIAAMNGDVKILEKLIETDPKPAREKVGRGDTVMHLCVKHHRFPALQFLAKTFGDLINEGDDDGDTVLHLAARYKQVEIIQYLVENNNIDKRSRNRTGKTPLQTLSQSPDPDTTTSEIREIFLRYENYIEIQGINKWRDVITVVVILIATMAFQTATNPPGGVWHDDSPQHKAGEAVMAYNNLKIYKHFVRANILAFVSSMIVITLITANLSSKYLPFFCVTIYMTWLSVASITVSYGTSIVMTTPDTAHQQTQSFIFITQIIAMCLVPYGIGVVWFIFSNKSVLKRRLSENFRLCGELFKGIIQSAILFRRILS